MEFTHIFHSTHTHLEARISSNMFKTRVIHSKIMLILLSTLLARTKNNFKSLGERILIFGC